MWQFFARLSSFFASPSPELPAPERYQIVKQGVAFDSFVNDLSGLGGIGDKGASAQPLTTRTRLVEAQLDALYQNSGIAGRIVDLIPAEATANGWYVRDPSSDTSPMADEDLRLNVWAQICKAWKNARKYGNGYLFMACEERIPQGYTWESWQKMPLDPNNLIRVSNLIDFDTLDCTVATWDAAEGSPNFRKPRTYIVNGQVAGTILTGVEVHWTRILRFSGLELPTRVQLANAGKDLSVLQVCLDSLRGNVTVAQAGANYVQEMGVAVLKSPHLVASSANEKSSLYNATMVLMAKTRSILSMYLLSADESLERTAPNISGFSDLDEAQRVRLCADTGIPMTKLFGAEPGGLSTDDQSGRVNWYAVLQNQQTTNLTPQLIRFYSILYRQQQGPTDGQIPQKWSIVYNPLEQRSEKESLETQKLAAEVDQLNIANGVYTAQHVARSRFGPRGWRSELLPVAGTDATVATPAAPAPGGTVEPVAPARDATGSAGDFVLIPEIPKGDIRRGLDRDMQPWAVIMPGEYGSIKGTRGLDGEPVDYLLGDGARGLAFVVEQLVPTESEEEAPELDEHKVVLGCGSADEAMGLLSGAYGKSGHWGDVFPVQEPQLLPWLQARSERRGYLSRDGADLRAPDAVRAAFKQGYDWYKAGLGASVSPATATWARRLAAGEPVKLARLKKVRAFHARLGEVERYASGDPTPRQITQHLWGGPEATAWADSLISQLEKR